MQHKRPKEQGGCEEIRMPIVNIRSVQGRRTLLFATGCVLCAAISSVYQFDVEGTEFSAGTFTRHLVRMHDVGNDLFILALIFMFIHSRAAVASALVAAFLCLPLYLYFLYPRPFRRAFPGEYKYWDDSFHWNSWLISAIVLIVFTVFLSVRGGLSRRLWTRDLPRESSGQGGRA